jgi:acetyl esterase/lipase
MPSHCWVSRVRFASCLAHCAVLFLLAGANWADAQTAEVAVSSPAARASELPPETFFRQPDVLRAELSPSGRRLAITAAKGNDRVGLIVIELTAQAKAKRAAQFKDVDIVNFRWVGDDRLVFSVGDFGASGNDEGVAAPGLYGVDVDGTNLLQLIALRRLRGVIEGPAGRRALEWYHQLLHVPDPASGAPADEVIVGRLEFSRDELRTIVPRWLNVRTGLTRAFNVSPPAGQVWDWLFDAGGEPRVAVTRRGGSLTVHWRAPGQADWQQLVEADALRMPWAPLSVDDTGVLYVVNQQGPEGMAVLSRYDFERGRPAEEPWVTVFGFDFNGSILAGRRGAGAAGVRVNGDAETTVWFDDRMKQLQREADALWPANINRLSCRRCGAPDMVVLVRSYSDRDPGRLWLYREETQRWSAVATVREGIEPQAMARVDFRRIQARDGRDLPLWLTLPAGVDLARPARPLPAVVLVHGGPWLRGGFFRWEPMTQFLASRGYLVLSPDFRGSTGYGDEHFRAGFKQWGQAMQDDLADALLWAQRQGLADGRACIAGDSYGGYATLMGLVRHPELYRCGVAWLPVTDPFLFLEGSWWVNDDIGASGRRYGLPEMVGDVKADREMLTRVSPVAQAGRIRAPLLLAFGEDDLRVPLAHGKRLREAMRKAGREPLWVTYPNEGHGWRQLSTRVDFALRIERFLAEHLAERPVP